MKRLSCIVTNLLEYINAVNLYKSPDKPSTNTVKIKTLLISLNFNTFSPRAVFSIPAVHPKLANVRSSGGLRR